MRPTTLGIIGLGAIGGSVARQALRAGVPGVLGWSPAPEERAAAAREGALSAATDAPEQVAERADLLILAAPPVANVELLERLAPRLRPGAFATDVSSVKRSIVARAQSLGLGARFAGSHPMAGSDAAGFAASRDDLFVDAVVYVTPTEGGAAAAREVGDFWERVLGARVVTLGAEAHDATVAIASHLPQIVASVLGHFLATHLPPDSRLGPGARDTTRLAGSPPGLWTEILMLNRDRVLPAVRALEEPLGDVERALETGDAAALEELLRRAADWRRGLAP